MAHNDPGEIYIVRMKTNLPQGQQQVNVFFYYDATGTAGGFNAETLILDHIEANMVPVLQAVMNELAIIVELECQDLFDETVLETRLLSAEGDMTGEFAANFVCAAFRSNRERPDIRRGQKRFSGLNESDIIGNDLNAVAQARMDAIAAVLGAPGVDSLLVDNFFPVIVKRVKVVDPVTGEVTYRLPANQGESDHFGANEWQFAGISHQVSRKIGRGT